MFADNSSKKNLKTDFYGIKQCCNEWNATVLVAMPALLEIWTNLN